jgi:hypothetical protein
MANVVHVRWNQWTETTLQLSSRVMMKDRRTPETKTDYYLECFLLTASTGKKLVKVTGRKVTLTAVSSSGGFKFNRKEMSISEIICEVTGSFTLDGYTFVFRIR